MIDVNGLNISYDGLRNVLDEISFGVEKGTFFGIIGPNGSGKTTLLKAMSRILTPKDGAISIGEKDLNTFSHRELAQHIGVVPQETHVSFDYSVREIVLMGRHPYIERLSSEKEEDLEIARHAMEMTNTLQFANRSINEISGGERQRVIIARALTQQPRVLLLDEPTSHLDISHQMEILNIIRNLKGEVTVVAVLHDLNLASYYCDRLILMNNGKIFSTGTPGEVLTKTNLKSIFHINAMIKKNPLTQKPYIIPIFEEDTVASGSLRIHVICGGGSGSELIYNLYENGYGLTTGVLCVNDSDFETATDLHIPSIAEPPFCRISAASLQELEKHISQADVIILTEMPFGTGNIENLRILEKYQEKNIIIFRQLGESSEMEDFTGGEASEILERLRASGATSINHIGDLLARLTQ